MQLLAPDLEKEKNTDSDAKTPDDTMSPVLRSIIMYVFPFAKAGNLGCFSTKLCDNNQL